MKALLQSYGAFPDGRHQPSVWSDWEEGKEEGSHGSSVVLTLTLSKDFPAGEQNLRNVLKYLHHTSAVFLWPGNNVPPSI